MVNSVTVRYPGPVAEISQITTPLPPRFTVGVRCFLLMCCVCVVLCIIAKCLHFGLVCPEDIDPELQWFLRCYVIFREKGLTC